MLNALALPVRLTQKVQMKSNCFTRNAKLFCKFATRSTTVLLNSRLKDFVIQGVWLPTVKFITEGQVSRPKYLKPMPCNTFIHSTIPKRLTYSAT
ncbi:hypothetical protein NPIL_304841 [Nephila pilipes]|uniref:Uncharacterized protein n=1 Tax=Nephila pilipes TaxID=299642 RepID=A0A8X6U5S4_NEPPI|nr:hypothetical protein NPIL_304841 [Nephila pilipes]